MRTPPRSHSRAAQGRELDLAGQSADARAAGAALDVIARVRAEPQLPLDAIVAGVAKERRAGARDRRALADLAFAWARSRGAIEPRVRDALKDRGGLRTKPRDLDRVVLAAAALESALDVAADLYDALAPELRELLDDALARPSTAHALPTWLAGRLSARADADGAALCAALSRRAPAVLAVDESAASVDDVRAALAALGVHAERSPVVPRALRILDGRLNLAALPAVLRDAVWPMDDASQSVALAVAPRPHEIVLDVCAGGGGKSRLLTSLGARVVSADLSRARLARSVPATGARMIADARAAPFLPRSFTRVLVDAPCSGTGTLRRAPDLAHRITQADVDVLVVLQREILCASAELVAPGGTLIYATCSLLAEENDDVIAYALRTSPDLVAAPLGPLWGGAVHGVADDETTHTFLPSREGTDGFFIAALSRRS